MHQYFVVPFLKCSREGDAMGDLRVKVLLTIIVLAV
jgi:hypothetical protein